MNKRAGLIFAVSIIIIALTAYYFRANLFRAYMLATKKIAAIENGPVSSFVSGIERQVIAPPPLQSNENFTQSVLTKTGTIDWTNRSRADNGNLPPLSENSRLDAAAAVKARDMFKNQYFAHVSPSGVGPADIAVQAGYDYLIIGQNLALGNFKDDQDLVNAWMNSPGHRANILNAKFTEIGVAVSKGTYRGKTVWMAVQEFGLPMSACPQADESLKSQIDADQIQLDSMQADLASRRQELNALLSRGDADAYNMKADEYNVLIGKYNQLLAATRSIVEQYNTQIRALNQCISGLQ